MSVTLRKVAEETWNRSCAGAWIRRITRYMNTDPKLTLEGQKKWFCQSAAGSGCELLDHEIDGTAAGVINYTGLTNPQGLGWAYYVGEKNFAQHPAGTGAGDEVCMTCVSGSWEKCGIQ